MEELLKQIIEKIMGGKESAQAIKELRELLSDEERRREKKVEKEEHTFEGTIVDLYVQNIWAYSRDLYITVKNDDGKIMFFHLEEEKKIEAIESQLREAKKQKLKVRIYYTSKDEFKKYYTALSKIDILSS